LYGIGVLQKPRSTEIERWRVDKARTIGGHLISLLAASLLSYQTSFGRRWRLAWLYEARVVFVASGCSEKRSRALKGGMVGLQMLGCFIAGRWLNTRSWRWASLLSLECVVSVAAPSVYSFIGNQAATLATKRFAKYAREVKSVVDVEVEQQSHLRARIAELEEQWTNQKMVETTLQRKLTTTSAKLDKYTDYAKQARGVVDRHIVHKKTLQARVDELEEAAKHRK